VGVEREVDRGQRRRGEAVAADRDDGMQGVRLRAAFVRGDVEPGRQATAAAVPIIGR